MYAFILALLSVAPTGAPEPPVELPVVEVRCGAALGGELDRPTHLKLSPQCVYSGGHLRSDHAIQISGGAGTRIEGGLSIEGAPALHLEGFAVEGPGAALHLRNIGPSRLARLILLGGIDGVSAHSVGPMILDEITAQAPGTGMWIQGAASVEARALHVQAGEVAAVIRDVPGAVALKGSDLKVLPGTGTSAVYISAEGPVEIRGNVVSYLGRQMGARVAVMEVDAEGEIADNRFIGMELGVRLRRRQVILGCNVFDGPWGEVEGAHVRDCPLDLAPNALDWRARVGGRIGPDGKLERPITEIGVSAHMP